LVLKLFSLTPSVVNLAVVPLFKLFVPVGRLTLSRTDEILTLMISSWFNLDLPYANVLIPTVVASDISAVKLVTPKNWVKDFEVYETKPVVVSA